MVAAPGHGGPPWFWDAVVHDLDLEWYTPYTQVLDLSRGLPWARWFDGGHYNYAHDAVDKQRHGSADGRARCPDLGGRGGRDAHPDLSPSWTRRRNRLAAALRALGIGKGDRVGIFLPMMPGDGRSPRWPAPSSARSSSRSSPATAPPPWPRAWPTAAPRLLITADGFYRRGKRRGDEGDRRRGRAPPAPAVRACAGRARAPGATVPWTAGRDLWWHELVAAQPRRRARRERTDAEDPYMIIYTSGTTGRPKGAVHVHGGFPIKGAQDLAHCFDVQAGDVLFWLTDIGWMMGPWAISGALMLGATLLLYEGTPDYPGPDRLWDAGRAPRRHRPGHLADRRARADGARRRAGARARPRRAARPRLDRRALGPRVLALALRAVGDGRCPIINYSGGTEISGGIVGCTTITPLKPCCFAGPVPGMAADVVDEAGQPVRGAVGELVIRAPWPGMTRGFWRDPRALPGHLLVAPARTSGCTATGPRSTPTASGTSAAAPTTRSRWPASASARPRWSRPRWPIPPSPRPRPSACPTSSKARRWSSSPCSGRAMTRARRCARRSGRVAAVLGKALRPQAVHFVRDLPRTRNAKIMRRVVRAGYLGT